MKTKTGWLVVGLVWPLAALAQPDYPALGSKAFSVEFHDGALIGSSRILGMAGAYTAVAEGVAGFTFNPASLAHRQADSDTWFDYDLSLDWLIPSTGESLDFENTGLPGVNQGDFVLMVGGIGLNFWRVGLGLTFRTQTYWTMLDRSTERGYAFGLFESDLGLAVEVFKKELFVGTSLSTAGMNVGPIQEDGTTSNLVSFSSGFLRLGALWVVPDSPWSLGLSLAGGTQIQRSAGSDEVVGGRILPKSLERPSELSFGVAYLIPFSHTKGDRRFLRWAGDLVLVGTSENAISMQGFFLDLDQPVGTKKSLAYRLGVESEVLNDRLIIRAGSYMEPSRSADRNPRFHVTTGLDLRLFDWIWKWKLSFALDVAGRYGNSSIGIGFWH